jgi:hypothetical protein
MFARNTASILNRRVNGESNTQHKNTMTIRPVRNKVSGERFLIINEAERLPIGIASLCCDTRISGFQIKCTECGNLYPVRRLNEMGYCEPCIDAEIASSEDYA